MADAVAAAGGGMPGSDLGKMNLAAPLADGMHLVVPWMDRGAGGDTLTVGDGLSGLPVDLNRAGVDRLTELPGVG